MIVNNEIFIGCGHVYMFQHDHHLTVLAVGTINWSIVNVATDFVTDYCTS